MKIPRKELEKLNDGTPETIENFKKTVLTKYEKAFRFQI